MHLSQWKVVCLGLLVLVGRVSTSPELIHNDRLSRAIRIVPDIDQSHDQGSIERNLTNTYTTRACLPNGDRHSCFQVIKGELGHIYRQTFNSSTEYRVLFDYNNPKQTFSVKVDSPKAKSSHPILFVVRQQKAVTSWELPFVLESASGRQEYSVYRRTLCPNTIETGLFDSLNFVVDISTSSQLDIDFTIQVSVENEFHVGLNEKRQFWLTPSENRFYKFDFPPEVSQVAVRSHSPDESICLTISVQSAQCPAFDTIFTIEYEGFRQTMLGSSTMIVQKNQFPNGFYVVYIVNVDDSKCLLEGESRPLTANRTKKITFDIERTVSVREFESALFIGTLSFYAGFVLLVVATCLAVETRRRRNQLILDKPISRCPPAQMRVRYTTTSDVAACDRCLITLQVDLMESSNPPYRDALGPHNSPKCNDRLLTFHSEDQVLHMTEQCCQADSTVQTNGSADDYKREVSVSDMTKQQPDVYNKRSKRYVSELCIIAVFYSIPVGQLVYNRQIMMTTTGDQDMCYYNWACAYPYQLILKFTDFNHFFSNIGYVILGIIFLCITKRRDYYHGITLQNSSVKEHGIPPHYGLFYAMGGALIVEGILSACYHICPSRVNFQFDTSFMYVIAALCTLKLYHARHADINVKSYTAYFVLAFIVLLGAGTPAHGEYYFKMAFTCFHLIACVALSVDVYYMGHCEFKFDKDRVQRHLGSCFTTPPLYADRLLLVVIATLCNVAFAVYELLENSVDFNTHILAVFMINLFVYSCFYVIMKGRKKECMPTRLYPFLHLVASIIFWTTGSFFFLQKAAKWEESPAGSRMLNQECIVAQVYDTHDLWHFLSSAALFFFFMFLLTVDDDVETKPRHEIPVF